MASKPAPPPQIGPYVFPTLLGAFGLWCFYDGWFSTDPKIQDYLLFNRIGSVVLLLWAIVDFIRTRRSENKNPAVAPSGRERLIPKG